MYTLFNKEIDYKPLNYITVHCLKLEVFFKLTPVSEKLSQGGLIIKIPHRFNYFVCIQKNCCLFKSESELDSTSFSKK